MWLIDSQGNKFQVSDDKGLYSFRLACKGLDRYADRNGCVRYMSSLTLSDDHLNTVNSHLHRFFSFLGARFRRLGRPFAYVWTVELQKRRYYKYGTAALHWHIIFSVRSGDLPSVEFRQNQVPHYRIKEDGSVVSIADMRRAWGRGQVYCDYARQQGAYNYLGKYIGKDYGSFKGYNLAWANLRRWGSSRLGWLASPDWLYKRLCEFEQEYGAVDDFYIRGRGRRLYARDSNGRKVLVMSFRSSYRRLQQ